MTTEREELATAIANRLDTFFGKREFGPAKQDYDLADALLDLGYRKPRTVKTAGDLDALPVGTVVRIDRYEVYEKHSVGAGATHWAATGDISRYDSGEIIDSYVSATVIHEGEA